MKLKFTLLTPLEICFCMASFFAKVKIFRFWPKSMVWFFRVGKKVVRKVYHPIGNEKRNLMALDSVA